MKYFILILFSFLFFISCNSNVESLSHAQVLANLINSNKEIRTHLINAFHVSDTSSGSKVFKFLISRRYNSVRITIHQIFHKEEITDLPGGYFYYKGHLFLFFDGSEILYNEKMQLKDVKLLLSKSDIKLDSSLYTVYDSQILQFDIDSNKRIKFNFPPNNPYDLTEVPAVPRWQNQERKDSLW